MPGKWLPDDKESYEFCEDVDVDDVGFLPPVSAPGLEAGLVPQIASRQWLSEETFAHVGGAVQDFSPVHEFSIGHLEYNDWQADRSDGLETQPNILSWQATVIDQANTSNKSPKRRKLPLLAPKPTEKPALDSKSVVNASKHPGLRPLAPKPDTKQVDFTRNKAPTSSSKIEQVEEVSPRVKRICLEKAVASNLRGATEFDKSILRGLASINLTMGFNTSRPKSRLDMYISALRQTIRNIPASTLQGSELQRALSAEGVLWTVREAWPAADGYWNMTATYSGFLAAENWRNFPCERTYRQLPPAYRPTRAQLVVPHSHMIDWLPWPDIRNLAIKYQDQIDIDALFRAAIHNVVAHRKRSLNTRTGDVALSPASTISAEENTSFRVWDLICLEKANGTDPLADSGLRKKAVLRSPSVKAVLQEYELEYDRFDTQKLDDRFFEEFPCLYAESAASSWKIQCPDNLAIVDAGRPALLTDSALIRLKTRIESLVKVRTVTNTE